MQQPELDPQTPDPDPTAPPAAESPDVGHAAAVAVPEIGGRNGPEPTRFGDWERNGRCIDF